MIQAVFFYYFAGATIISAVLTVALRSPVYCGLSLLSMLLHVAGLFVLLNAEFIAAVQVIIYAGAILVLYLFVLMLLNLKTEERFLHSRYAIILFFAFLIGGEFYWPSCALPFPQKSAKFLPRRSSRWDTPRPSEWPCLIIIFFLSRSWAYFYWAASLAPSS